MHLDPRGAATAALLALVVAACGSSASPAPSGSPAAATAPAASDPAAASPSNGGSSASPAPAVSVAPSGSAAPSGSTAPASTPTPEQQALMALLPAQVGTVKMSPKNVDAEALINADPEANKGLVEFLTKIGLQPRDLLIAFDAPVTPTQVPFSIGAYRFTGAAPATLKDEFIKANLANEPGSTTKEQTVGGRQVTALLAPSGQQGPPIYLLFKGDTVFVVSSTDATFAADAVKAMP